MRALLRTPLNPGTLQYLATETNKVKGASDPKKMAADRWAAKNKKHFATIRAELEHMASGRSRCMYCEDSFGTDIDHFAPKSDYPSQAFAWANYLLACSHCNSNEKRTKFPVDSSGAPLLIDPTIDDPNAHLVFVPTTGEFIGRTAKGSHSIAVFGLNRAILLEGRTDAWNIASALIRQYAISVEADAVLAEKYLRTLKYASFNYVLIVMVEYARAQVDVLPAEVRKALREYPELTNWL